MLVQVQSYAPILRSAPRRGRPPPIPPLLGLACFSAPGRRSPLQEKPKRSPHTTPGKSARLPVRTAPTSGNLTRGAASASSFPREHSRAAGRPGDEPMCVESRLFMRSKDRSHWAQSECQCRTFGRLQTVQRGGTRSLALRPPVTASFGWARCGRSGAACT